jgi:beta-phosphoglucomutase-like phosphatase (HAD superfamily)/predicted ATP-grasp superfamily ATP-dependent carboligase
MDTAKGVLVVSANQRKAYPVIESVSRMGLRVIAAFYAWRSPVFSRHIRKRYFIASPYTDEECYLSHVRSIVCQNNIVMIIPVGFVDSVVLARHRKLLPQNIVLPIPSYEALMKASDKVELVKLCKDIGAMYPRTLSLAKTTPGGTSKSLGLPLVVKGGSDASTPQYAFTMKQLKEKTEDRGDGKILQEFIAGGGAGYFAISQNGEILAEYGHSRIIEEKPSGGPSLVACINSDPEIFKLGRKVVKHLSWTGALMVEFKRDYETGEYYVLEINPKLWGSLDLAVCKKIDFPRYMVETFLYGKKPEISREALNFRGGCFAWVLSGMNYLKENPVVWFRILKYYLKNGVFSGDIHLGDPAELTYSLVTRVFNSMFRGYGSEHLKKNWVRSLRSLADSIGTKSIGAIVFDFDGTIVNLEVDWSKVKEELVRRKLTEPWESIMVSLYKTRHTSLSRFKATSKIAEKYENKALEKIKPNKGLRELFSGLRNLEIKLAVVSKQTSGTVALALKRLGIHERFEIVVGREYSMSRKEQLVAALESMKALPSTSIFVEDTVTDATSAAKLHLAPIGVSRNPYRFQQLVELGVPTFTKIDDCINFILRMKRRDQE